MEKVTHRKLTQSLMQLWLWESDCTIYLLWLEMGASTVVQLADESGIHRVTVHDIVWRLVDRWLFLETRSGQRRLVYPKQVDSLQSLVDHKASELTILQTRVTEIMSLLRDVQLSSQYLPQIRFYKWQEGIAIVGKEMLEDGQAIHIVSDSRHFDDLIDNKFLDKAVWHPSPIALLIPMGYEHFSFTHKAKHDKLSIKYLTADQSRRGAMSIRWDKVALHSYEGIYITTTIMQNPPIAAMMRASFQAMRGAGVE